MSRDNFLDGGAYCRTARSLGNTTTVDAEVNGGWVSRFLYDADDVAQKGIAHSAKLVINYSAVLAEDETLTLAGNFQDAVDDAGTGAADYADAVAATLIATGPTGGATISDTVEIDIDLSGAREFIRPQVTFATSAAGTIAFSASIVFFGDHRQPSTRAIATLGGATDV